MMVEKLGDRKQKIAEAMSGRGESCHLLEQGENLTADELIAMMGNKVKVVKRGD